MTIADQFEMADVNHPEHPMVRLLRQSYARHSYLNELQQLILDRYSRGREREDTTDHELT